MRCCLVSCRSGVFDEQSLIVGTKHLIKASLAGSLYSRLTYLRRASLLLMKRKWAGSQMKPADWQASTQDWPSWDTSSLRELRGGQAEGAVTLDAQPRAVVLGRGTNRGPIILLPPADPFLERLAGMKGGSGAQKSWRWNKYNNFKKSNNCRTVKYYQTK